MKSYQMGEQLKQGEEAERYLDSLFADEFNIKNATRAEQRRGIDRHFTRKSDGKKWAIEYKADTTAARTGNAFVETISVDVDNKPGWALYCEADFVMYYIVGIGPIYIIRPDDIRSRLDTWKSEYRIMTVPNEDYNTKGIIVPLAEFEKIAAQIINN